MVETKVLKVLKTRRLDFTCSVFATCNDTKKLKERLLSRFAVIEMKPYDTFQAFRQVTLDVLKDHPLADYIATEVWRSSKKRNPNVRDCVRIGKIVKTEQDVLRLLRVFKQ